MPEQGHERDKRILLDILVTIEHRLHFIVSEGGKAPLAKPRFRKEFVQMFPGPWDEVVASFQQARNMIQNDEVNWEYIEGLGMAGRMLEWKKRFFDETIRENAVGRFFKVANAILGSLSKAIPPLEVVKEYKEHVEAAMRYVRS